MGGITHGVIKADSMDNHITINMKKPNKKNEQKLKLYLSKTNGTNTKPGIKTDSKPDARTQAGANVQARTGN